jgi:hypothetical protein
MDASSTSARFGIIGVLVVMAACAVIGITMGSGQEKPRLALGLIFGIIALYLVILFTLQRRDVNRAAGADAEARARDPQEIENPATMSDAELFAAMAVKPISAEASEARAQGWEMARGSINLGIVICVLIFAGVVPIYLLDTFVPFFICAPLIGIIALVKSVRLLGGGSGSVDAAYETAGKAVEPLGLRMTEHPEVGVEPRATPPYSFKSRISGQMVMEGKRHGRSVRVVNEGGSSQVTVGGRVAKFETKARDGRIRLGEDGPPGVRDALEGVPSSTRWNGVTVEGGAAGITVRRKRDKGSDFLCDLWLAERLAAAARKS